MAVSALHRLVAERIVALAEDRELSINLLADFSGLSRGHLSNVLRGTRSPTLRTLERIAEGLEVEVRDLIPKVK